MNGHSEEPLYSVLFTTGAEATRFVQMIREAMQVAQLHRHTPPGPLVIYGPPDMTSSGAITLYVTAGILRAAEILQLPVARRSKLNGADALPDDAIVLFAHLGGEGPSGRWRDEPRVH